ncbi:Crp/Fnr family transcriptional regulator [Dinghuibacter silviterrae]|uniref:CRP-like cAMP-binding protein n=1 Tax=Dinghuibacter silviterrae TaxID=1539049 RepID=A0A4R8DSE5_9BACT|nr:Crp/Fnr family transcriptional regulator [Dinghuibacter silviterrae]TDX00335.1 CRP-like cAMP-binding protein [Dinghuibacter silviterrae]
MDAPTAIREAFARILPLPDDEWQAFVPLLDVRHHRKGDFLIREGQVAGHIYFLYNGATRNYFLKDGKEYTVDFHFKGDFVAAYLSFITREPSPVFIECLEDTETVAIAYDPLQEFYRHSHQGERIGRLMAEHQYVRRLRREMDILALTAEERYKQLLDKHPGLISALSVKHLSSYLGIQPESLSRIRKTRN